MGRWTWGVEAGVLAPEVRALLVCPVCRGALEDRPDELACVGCGLGYPVVHGVPHLLRERARKLDKPAVDRGVGRR